MSQTGTFSSGIARHYASALFDLALADGKLAAVEKDLKCFNNLLEDSEDFSRLVASPVFSVDDKVRGVDSILDRIGVRGVVADFLRVVAQNCRASAMPEMLRAFQEILAKHQGRETALVSVATPLSPEQKKELTMALRNAVRKDVGLQINVDPSLLGGMIVRIGSRQVDASLQTRLSSLKLVLKEVD